MIWTRPEAFLALIALPPIFILIARSVRRRNQKIAAVFSDNMRDKLFASSSKTLAWIKYAFLFLAFVAFICVMAGPKFGKELETHKTLGRDVFVLFDASDSMLAEDVSPNRLTVARLDVEDLLDAAVGDRLGLVAFAGSSQVEIPLTTDYEFFRELLRKVDTKTVKVGGTAIGDAIRLALKRFGQEEERKRLIFLITDGEDHDSLPLEAAKNAADMNVPIIAIAIGSPEGARIPVFNVSGVPAGYKMFDGKHAVSKPDVETLKEIAKISGGRFFYADSRLDLAKVYESSVEIQDRSEIGEDARVLLKDRYQPFLAVGLVSFMIYYVFPVRVRRKNQRTITQIVALIVALTPAFLLNAGALAQDALSDSEKTVAQKLSRREQVRKYNDSLKLAESDKEDFEAIQRELAEFNNPEVSSRANYNLGVAELEKARNAAQELTAPLSESDQNQSENAHSETIPAAPSDNPQQPPANAVEKYKKERSERDDKRQEIYAMTKDASQKFFRATESKKVGKTSLQDAEAVANWSAQLSEREQERETTLRDEALPDPNDRLAWLEEELGATVRDVRDLSRRQPDAQYYRRLNAQESNVKELESDVDAIASKLGAALESADASAPFEVAGAQTADEEGARKIAEAQDVFTRHEREAAKALSKYDPVAAQKELRLAETQLTTFRDVPSPYDTLVTGLLQQEELRAQRFDQTAEKPLNSDDFDDYHWSRASLSASVDETMRKARRIVDAAPAPMTSPAVEAPDVPSVPEHDEIVFDSNEPDAASEELPKSPEERALESAKIALDREQALADAIRKASELTDAKNELPEDTEELEKTHREIVEMLREIARPFQDENQQNQNQQNQDEQNQDQNTQDQEQSQDQRDQDEQDSQDRQNQEDDEIPEELDQPDQQEDEDSANEEKDAAPQETPVEVDTPQSAREQPSTPELTEEQKKAEELMRRVMRRQKDAEPLRDAVREAFKKRETSGKDW